MSQRKGRVEQECERYGITKPPLISARVTQTYDVGACVYFYLAFSYLSVNDPIRVFDTIEVGVAKSNTILLDSVCP